MTIVMRPPRSALSRRFEIDRRSTSSKLSVRAETSPGGGVRPSSARPFCDLPDPDLADDAEPLAAEPEGDAAHRFTVPVRR